MPLNLAEQFTILVIGFSVFAAVILVVAYLFFLQGMEKTRLGMLSCSVLLIARRIDVMSLRKFSLAIKPAGSSLPLLIRKPVLNRVSA